MGEKSRKINGVWVILGIEGNMDSWNMTFLEMKVLRMLRSRTFNLWYCVDNQGKDIYKLLAETYLDRSSKAQASKDFEIVVNMWFLEKSS